MPHQRDDRAFHVLFIRRTHNLFAISFSIVADEVATPDRRQLSGELLHPVGEQVFPVGAVVLAGYDVLAGDGIQVVQQLPCPGRGVPVDRIEAHPAVKHIPEPQYAVDHCPGGVVVGLPYRPLGAVLIPRCPVKAPPVPPTMILVDDVFHAVGPLVGELPVVVQCVPGEKHRHHEKRIQCFGL